MHSRRKKPFTSYAKFGTSNEIFWWAASSFSFVEFAGWEKLLPLPNSKCSSLQPKWTVASRQQIFADASGATGCCGLFDKSWFQVEWPLWIHALCIPTAWIEIVPDYFACRAWGLSWTGLRLFVNAWRKFSSPNHGLMDINIIPRIYFEAATNSFALRIAYIPVEAKIPADVLSRFDIFRFSACGHTEESSSDARSDLIELLEGLMNDMFAAGLRRFEAISNQLIGM